MKLLTLVGAALAVLCIGATAALAFDPAAITALDMTQLIDPVAAMAMVPAHNVLNQRARGLYSVRADGANAVLNELKKTVEEFKAAHEEEIQGLKNKFDDVVTKEKVDRINDEISNLTKILDETNAALAALRVGGGGGEDDPDKSAYATAFNKWFRKGDRAIDADLSELAVKAKLTTDSDPDGGYVVAPEMDSAIDRVLGTVSAMRNLARVISISSDEYKKLVNMGGAGSGWVGERESRTETDTPSLRELVFNTAEIYANPAITQRLLDDASLDVAQWLADEVAIEFAEQEGAAFITGDGVKKPRGFLAYDTVANASYAWGKLGFIVSGGAAGFASSDPADAIIDLYYALKAGYRNGATWLTSDAVMKDIRKFKDGQGNYLWAPPSGPDMPSTILGKPVDTDDNMPALGANAFPLSFGNFSRGYLIIDRIGARVLRDPFTNKPYVHFYTTKRVGGGVQNFEAIKLLKCST